MAKKSWKDFPVSCPPPKKGFDNACMEFDEVTHVAHVTDAIRVIEDHRIRSSLVYDESCLNTKRTQVSWVSPKTWAHGYIYGNVAFVFDWAKLVKDQRVYWVEHRQTTGQQICRFLICEDEFTDDDLEEYDYTKPHGPLFYDEATNQWYHNNKITSEYMIMDDLYLHQCKAIRFVDHHRHYCNKTSSCPDLRRSRSDAGADVLGGLIGTWQTHVAELFEGTDKPGETDFSVQCSALDMSRSIVKQFDPARTGSITQEDGVEVMKSILFAFSWERKEQVSALLAQFPSKKAVESAYWSCLNEFFNGLKVRMD